MHFQATKLATHLCAFFTDFGLTSIGQRQKKALTHECFEKCGVIFHMTKMRNQTDYILIAVLVSLKVKQHKQR